MKKSNMELSDITPGFSDPVADSQACYKTLLESMARPGRVKTLGRCPVSGGDLHPATLAIALTLLDFETLLWADPRIHEKSLHFLTFHCGPRLTTRREKADFAIIKSLSELDSLDRFKPGTDESPYESATLIVQLEGVANGTERKLTGPGIKDRILFRPEGLGDAFWEKRSRLSLFPMGVDLIFTCGNQVVSIPRTTRVCGF